MVGSTSVLGMDMLDIEILTHVLFKACSSSPGLISTHLKQFTSGSWPASQGCVLFMYSAICTFISCLVCLGTLHLPQQRMCPSSHNSTHLFFTFWSTTYFKLSLKLQELFPTEQFENWLNSSLCTASRYGRYNGARFMTSST